jgi:hypothetical protein
MKYMAFSPASNLFFGAQAAPRPNDSQQSLRLRGVGRPCLRPPNSTSTPGAMQNSAAYFDSLGDLNFMEKLPIVVWTIRQIGCWIIGG